MRDLPLNALRVLAAVRQSGGGRPAARFLQVAPSAVHRQLREIERRLGFPIVEAGSRPLRFTPEGERLASQALDALGALDAGWRDAIEARRANTVSLSVSASFAARWLVPRLPRLRARHPRIALTIVTEGRLVDLPREASLALRMGSGPWKNVLCEPLMEEKIFPIASAAAWEASGSPRDPEKVLQSAKLHDRDPQASWSRWAAAFGLDAAGTRQGDRFTSSDLVLSAAALGLGFAMARGRLAADAIQRGELSGGMRHLSVPLGVSYWIVRAPALRSVDLAFLDWLKDEAAAG